MAQVSYGTITITDTNDIESIIVEYARNQSTSSAPTSGWSTTRPAWEQGYYIWQHTRTHKAGTDPSTDDIGTAVCITGSTGQTGGTGAAGRSLTNTITQYTTATNSATITQSNMGNYTWNSNVPTYSSSTPAYWVRVTNTYSNPSSTEYIIYKDNGLTDAITKSVEANDNAVIASSIAQHANENSQGAMSQAAEANYKTEALAAKVKHYWWDSTGAHIASGINGADVTEDTASTYGFNSLVGLASITFGYNSYKAVELDGSIPALKFYKPSKTAQGALTATLNSNGLILSEGGIEAGTKNTNDYIYVYSKDDATNHTLNINNSGNKSDWRIIAGNNFGVDKAGNLYASNAHVSGIITVNSGSNVYTKTEADGAFDAYGAAANASYSIEVKVTAIDYTNSSATLVAVPYYQGSTTLPTLPNGANYSYRWYKGTTALSNTSNPPTISGATTTTLVLGQGSDLEAIYVCVISKP